MAEGGNMTTRALEHRRVHNLLLFQKLLSLREGTSPFTLVLDTIEQPSKSVLRCLIKNAQASKAYIVFISFETPKPGLRGIDEFITGVRKPLETLTTEIKAACAGQKHILLIFDTLLPLCGLGSTNPIGTILTPLIMPTVSLVAIYHTDIPLPTPNLAISPSSPYQPSPLTTLRYLATAILSIHPFPQTVARKHASNSALPDPLFGLEEGKDGVVIGLTPKLPTNGADTFSMQNGSVVVEMEYRRKSGRAVEETFILPPHGAKIARKPMLLEDHPLWRKNDTIEKPEDTVKEGDVTFRLGLTDKERREREGVVLPYYDAQRRGKQEEEEGSGAQGIGDGGRIIYEMGAEDDFDEEEDEI